MKILVVGKNNIMEWPQSVNNALRSLSFDTELFLFNKRNFTYCFMRLFGKKIRHKWLAKVFENKIRKTQPNLISEEKKRSYASNFAICLRALATVRNADEVSDPFLQVRFLEA